MTRRTQADWIRGFAAQGMTQEEILGLLGTTRFQVTNAMRHRNAGEAAALALPGCEQCGAKPFAQMPSMAGACRRCGACGSHYRHWIANAKPKKPRFQQRAANTNQTRPVQPIATRAERAALRAVVDRRRAALALRQIDRTEHLIAALVVAVGTGIAELRALNAVPLPVVIISMPTVKVAAAKAPPQRTDMRDQTTRTRWENDNAWLARHDARVRELRAREDEVVDDTLQVLAGKARAAEIWAVERGHDPRAELLSAARAGDEDAIARADELFVNWATKRLATDEAS